MRKHSFTRGLETIYDDKGQIQDFAIPQCTYCGKEYAVSEWVLQNMPIEMARCFLGDKVSMVERIFAWFALNGINCLARRDD